MGTLDEAVRWARENLHPQQFKQFAEQLHLPKKDEYVVSVRFKWNPSDEPHLVTVEDIESFVRQGLSDWDQPSNVEVWVEKRSTY